MVSDEYAAMTNQQTFRLDLKDGQYIIFLADSMDHARFLIWQLQLEGLQVATSNITPLST